MNRWAGRKLALEREAIYPTFYYRFSSEALSMDYNARHERTVRLLADRLETLAVASIRSPGGERAYRDHILAAVAATRHAVALDLLSTKEAGAVWAQVAKRHPEASWCAAAPDLAGPRIAA